MFFCERFKERDGGYEDRSRAKMRAKTEAAIIKMPIPLLSLRTASNVISLSKCQRLNCDANLHPFLKQDGMA